MSTSAKHNAIMKTSGKDRALMLVAGSPFEFKMVTHPATEAIETSAAKPKRIGLETYSSVSEEKRSSLMLKAFGKFTSREGESLESYYFKFYKLMNELVINKCDVSNYQVNVQFLLQLQPEWQRFVTIVKHGHDLKIVSYYILFDILKQHQNEVNKIRDERLDI
ncbi:hypothetical protein Tco_0517061 [Tanacetum coccineum]